MTLLVGYRFSYPRQILSSSIPTIRYSHSGRTSHPLMVFTTRTAKITARTILVALLISGILPVWFWAAILRRQGHGRNENQRAIQDANSREATCQGKDEKKKRQTGTTPSVRLPCQKAEIILWREYRIRGKAVNFLYRHLIEGLSRAASVLSASNAGKKLRF
jgi:hypothetical protein